MDINFNAFGVQEINGTKDGTIFYDLLGAPEGLPETEHGSFEQNEDGSYRYTPTAGFFGVETLTFSNGQTMTLHVAPPEDQGLQDVIEGIVTIGTTMSYNPYDGEHVNYEQHQANENLKEVDFREFNHFTLENQAKWSDYLMGNVEAIVDEDGNVIFQRDEDGNLILDEDDNPIPIEAVGHDRYVWRYNWDNLDHLLDRSVGVSPEPGDDFPELSTIPAENFKINFHTLIWGTDDATPSHLKNLYSDFQDEKYVNEQGEIEAISAADVLAMFKENIDDHIEQVISKYGQIIDKIDVVNEDIYHNDENVFHKVFSAMGEDYIEYAFEKTRDVISAYNENNPDETIDPQLAINDFLVIYNYYEDGDTDTDSKADLYYNRIKGLLDSGVDIDVVGFQAHFYVERATPSLDQNQDGELSGQELYRGIYNNLQRFIDLGVEIHISELDVAQSFANDTGDSDFSMFYEVIGALAHDLDEITAVTFWSTTDEASRIGTENDPAIFEGTYNSEEGYTRKPEYFAFLEGITGNSEFNGTSLVPDNNIYGTDDEDFINGTANDDVIYTVENSDGNTDRDEVNGSRGNDVVFGESDYNQVNYLGDQGYINNFTFVRNEDQSVTATSEYFGTDTLWNIHGIWFGGDEEWKSIDSLTTTEPPIENGNPVAVDDTVAQAEIYATSTVSVLDNDSDPDGDALTITEFGGKSVGSHSYAWIEWINDVGVVTLNQNGTLSISHSYEGNYSFDYTISDGNGNFDTATVSGTVGVQPPANAAPIAEDDTVAEAVLFSTSSVAALDNDSDPDGDALTITEFGGKTVGSHDYAWSEWIDGVGVVTLNQNGTFSVNHRFEGDYSFDYTVSDGNGHSDTATVSGTVEAQPPANAAPSAENDTVAEAVLFSTSTVAALDNDSDPDGDALIITEFGGKSVGSHDYAWSEWIDGVGVVTLNQNGTFSVNHRFEGDYSFDYTISDGNGHSDTATVSGTVETQPPVNSAPIAANDTVDQAALYDTSTVAVLDNDSDPDGDALTITEFGGKTVGSHDYAWAEWINDVGVVTLNENGTFSISHGFEGSYSFDYTVSDGNGHFDTATVSGSVGDADRVELIVGTRRDDLIDGTDFDDEIHGLRGVDTFIGSSGNDVIYGQTRRSDEYNQVNYQGDGVSLADFTFTENEDGSGSVIATSAKFGTDTLYGIEGVYFEEDGWIPMQDLLN